VTVDRILSPAKRVAPVAVAEVRVAVTERGEVGRIGAVACTG
jgi:hypothetical protein